jgi:hypothetical protein
MRKVGRRQLLQWNRKHWQDGGKCLGNSISKDIANDAEEDFNHVKISI